MLRIALAEDQALVRSGLKALLEMIDEIEVVIEAQNGEELLNALRSQIVEVIVSDICMSHASGIEVVRRLRQRGDKTPVLLITTFDDPDLLNAAIAAGAQGFMLKDALPEEFYDTLQRLVLGQTLLKPMSLPSTIKLPLDGYKTVQSLTVREQDILRLVAGGYSNKHIAQMLDISEGTVKNYMTDILRKLDARDRTHAVLKAMNFNFI
ncbi:response regulator transcription factor [Acinetobacter sp. Ac_5812]|uniref:response regulator n=1 Tax=Acinetobacter sp. Ac_5812 TaxID=1848937 RepID=UPI00148F77BF|nr:response regulator transcription factor [Acinetobacter sp. Ac_5812]NNP67967.1 DNA-binding response regulator [Acinetobacter sp. Ac_5812]